MHELGIVFHAIDILEDTAREQNFTRIESVMLELGEVSGVVTGLFEDAWNWACNRHELLRDSELHIEIIPAVTVCNACGKTYATVQHGKQCPHCESFDTELLSGQELNIKEITVP